MIYSYIYDVFSNNPYKGNPQIIFNALFYLNSFKSLIVQSTKKRKIDMINHE